MIKKLHKIEIRTSANLLTNLASINLCLTTAGLMSLRKTTIIGLHHEALHYTDDMQSHSNELLATLLKVTTIPNTERATDWAHDAAYKLHILHIYTHSELYPYSPHINWMLHLAGLPIFYSSTLLNLLQACILYFVTNAPPCWEPQIPYHGQAPPSANAGLC